MAQFHGPLPQLPAAPPVWDPTATLKFRVTLDGQFYCSGINKKSQVCGWTLDDKTQKIRNQLVHLSRLLPQEAVECLDTLAQLAFCHHHQNQRWSTVDDWKMEIRAIRSAHTAPTISELSGASASEQTLPVPHCTSPRPSYQHGVYGAASSEVASRRSEGSFPSIQSDYDSLWKKFNNLQDSLDCQKRRINDLEFTCEELRKGASHKKHGRLWGRLKASLQSIFKNFA